VAKVKKAAAVTGVRNVKASNNSSKDSSRNSAQKPGRTSLGKSAGGSGRSTAGKQTATRASGAKPAAKVAPRRQVAKQSNVAAKAKAAKQPGVTKRTKAKPVSRVKPISKARSKARLPASAPVVRVVVKALEPQARCGAGTSVQYLFRVDETVDGRLTRHLVFFDRHGWYCEHGRNCPAVGHAKKYQGHMARAS